MAKYTYEQIKKAVNYCLTAHDDSECEGCPFYDDVDACKNKISLLLDLINRQEAEKQKLEYILSGVMLFVDKWLEGDELSQDEVNRARIMRERTLEIVEKQEAEIDRLNNELRLKVEYIHEQRDVIDEKEAEIERLTKCRKEEVEKLMLSIDKVITEAKSEAIKEFVERLKEEAQNYPDTQYGKQFSYIPAVSIKKSTTLRKKWRGSK